MTIINITPDSFSDGGKYFNEDRALAGAKEAEKQGADIIDFGAYSTRPGHVEIDEEEEWRRLKGTLKRAVKEINVPISVDTFTPSVAKAAIDTGVQIINDVSGKINPEIAQLVKNTGCGWVIMHNGEGEAEDVFSFFKESLAKTDSLGIDRGQICLDMGIGFGKSREQDYSLIVNIPEYKIDGVPLMLGTSRKRAVGEGSGETDPQRRTYGNIAADTVAIFGGADIIRLHDTENEKHGIYMADTLKRAALNRG